MIYHSPVFYLFHPGNNHDTKTLLSLYFRQLAGDILFTRVTTL
ncbi:hypothetical protein CSB69_2429 [Morganella morganii]|nr:hypothetical protein CSB69_2429 [Morganella morganii]EMP50580.1 hypothetical protein C790_02460 [Morganella morganii SC01]